MLKLTAAFTKNPRLQPLMEGTVAPQNIELQCVLSTPTELFYRNLKYDEFDVFEMSLSEYLMTKERGDGSKWNWSALPVFPSKALIWLNLFVNTGTQIASLGELKGKRVGIPDYPMTAALWMRIILEELYGVRPGDIEWYNGRTREFSHGAALGLDQGKLFGVSLTWLTEQQTLDVMLHKGELDAAYGFPPRHDPEVRTFTNIDRYGGTPVEGNPKIRKLLPDSGRQVITEYYQKTGLLPANHVVVVQKKILDEEPWVALELLKAFQRAKEIAYERAKASQTAYLLFGGDDYKNQAASFGQDPFPLGLRENRKMLELLFQNSHKEGLTRKLARVEDVFFRSTLNT